MALFIISDLFFYIQTINKSILIIVIIDNMNNKYNYKNSTSNIFQVKVEKYIMVKSKYKKIKWKKY